MPRRDTEILTAHIFTRNIAIPGPQKVTNLRCICTFVQAHHNDSVCRLLANIAVLRPVRNVSAMPRLTIALEERDHMALRLVSIRDHKRLNEVIDDAIKHYLSATGAYSLVICDVAESPLSDQEVDGKC
jgi:hypothetical protein